MKFSILSPILHSPQKWARFHPNRLRGSLQDLAGATPPSGLVLLSILAVQVGAAGAKILLTKLDPISASFLRFGLTALMLMLMARYSHKFHHYSRGEYLLVGLFGAAIALLNLTFYGAISLIPLGITVAIAFIGPLGLAVMGSRRSVDLLWVTLAAIGVLLLTPLTGAHLDPLGVLLAMISALCWAVYILLAARVGQVLPGGTGLTLGMIATTILLLPFGIPLGGMKLLQPSVLLLGIGVAFLGTVIPYSLEFAALKRMPPKVFGVLMSVEPAIAALVGFVLLGEKLAARTIIAIAMVTVAAIGSTLSTKES